MASSHQVLCTSSGRVVTPHHVAHRINCNLVKASRLHGLLNAGTASQMGLCEVCHGKLTVIFEAWIAVLGQCFVPVPNFIALCRVTTSFVIEANFNNAVNVAQTFRQFEIGMTFQAALKGGHDLVLVQTQASWPAHSQNKGPSKFLLVSCIEGMDLFKLFWRAICEARLGLLVGRFSC